MTELDDQRVRALAELARLSLDEEERLSLAADLEAILGYAERIQSLATDGVAPATRAILLAGGRDPRALRDDVPAESLERDRVLDGAPDAADGLFKVPKVLP